MATHFGHWAICRFPFSLDNASLDKCLLNKKTCSLRGRTPLDPSKKNRGKILWVTMCLPAPHLFSELQWRRQHSGKESRSGTNIWIRTLDPDSGSRPGPRPALREAVRRDFQAQAATRLAQGRSQRFPGPGHDQPYARQVAEISRPRPRPVLREAGRRDFPAQAATRLARGRSQRFPGPGRDPPCARQVAEISRPRP